MANAGKFPEQGAYARPLIERRVLRRLAIGLIMMAVGAVLVGIWADDVVVVIFGMLGVLGSGAWRLWLVVPSP
jgi:hypothetical protein